MLFKTILLKTVVCGAAMTGLAAYALAQAAEDDETFTGRVIVESSRLAQTATEMGSSVSVLSADDIEKQGFDFVLDAIATVPGVTVNSNGAFGGAAAVRIRGANSEQTLVLIDGVPVNDPTSPGGGFNFARLDTASIDRIEVLKGAQSTLWGGDAIGGVVSIVTKRPQPGPGGSAFGEYGSFNTIRGGVSIGNAGEAGAFRLAVVGTSSDGISKADTANGNRENDPYDALTLSAGSRVRFTDAIRLDTNLLWTGAKSAYDSFSATSPGKVADGDEISKTREFSGHATLTSSLFDGLFDSIFLLGYTDTSRNNLTDGQSSFSAAGDRLLYRYQGTLDINAANTLAFGAEREDTRSGDDSASTGSLFILHAFRPLATLTLTGGFRMDDHERFGTQTTGRVAAAFKPDPRLTLRASWGQGFKAPTVFQTTYFCCGAKTANTSLRAETSEGFDVGVDWQSTGRRTGGSLVWFDQNVENQINFAFAIGGYENIAQTRSRGIEIHGYHRFADWLDVSVNYARIDARDGAGKALTRVPEHSGDITVSLDPDGPFSGAILVRYNGREPEDQNTYLNGWTRVDLSAIYTLSDRIELSARIENVFDRQYQQIFGYGTPGLSGSVGLKVRY